MIGTVAQCPTCRKQTELLLPAPAEEPLVPRKVLVWTVITCLILVLGVVAVVVGLKHFEKVAARQVSRRAVPGTMVPAGLEISALSVRKEPGSLEGYVVGTLANRSSGTRSNVTIQLELLDVGGQSVGIGRAYRPKLEPGAKWEFKVSMGESKAVTARLASIKEGQ